MSEQIFFPPQLVEMPCPNIPPQAGTKSDGRSCSDQEHIHDDLQETTKLKSDIVSHPLYEQLLDAHISCIRVCLPVDYIKEVEAQVANKHRVAMKYLILGRNDRNTISQTNASHEIDKFMENYLLFLHSLKNHLEDHSAAPVAEAMAAYCELERTFQELTETVGTHIGDSQFHDASIEMSMEDFVNDKEDLIDAAARMQIEEERSLFNHVHEVLKMELKEGFLEKITSIREEILRKRKAGTLQGDTSILKQWWNSHLKWPYPTEEEKRLMVETTGLELRQINNWFINHRKRNWNGRDVVTGPSASNSQTAPTMGSDY